MDLQNMLQEIMKNPNLLKEMGNKVGASEKEVQKAALIGVPTLVEALNRNAKNEASKESLARALDNHKNDDVDNLESFLGKADMNDGNKMLGHILGQDRSNVENRISTSTGLGGSQVQSLLSLLAPMLMGMLGKKKKEENVSDHNIGSLTDTLKNSLGSATGGGILDLAKGMLDKDNDGSVMDDLIGGLFGKK